MGKLRTYDILEPTMVLRLSWVKSCSSCKNIPLTLVPLVCTHSYWELLISFPQEALALLVSWEFVAFLGVSPALALTCEHYRKKGMSHGCVMCVARGYEAEGGRDLFLNPKVTI